MKNFGDRLDCEIHCFEMELYDVLKRTFQFVNHYDIHDFWYSEDEDAIPERNCK